jgi:hypothetical protein
VPIPINLFSSPGQNGKNKSQSGSGVIYIAAPSAVDQNAYGVNATAQAPTSLKMLNYWYPSGDAIRMDFTTVPNANGTVYLDCMLQGYYLPDRLLDYWKGAF